MKMNINERIESFLNGNIIDNKRALARQGHGKLSKTYMEITGCCFSKGNAFADYIKGNSTFQEYCDSNHQPTKEVA